MTEQIPGLMGFVVRAVKTDPAISSKELYDRSSQRYPAVAEMTVRQFHARYPLQAKRQLNRPVVRRFPVPRPDGPEGERSAVELAEETAAEADRLAGTRRVPPPVEGGPGPRRAAEAADDRSGETPLPPVGEAPPADEPPARKEPEDGSREALRRLFFRLALEVEGAPTRSELVDVVAGLDGYVEEAMVLVGADRD